MLKNDRRRKNKAARRAKRKVKRQRRAKRTQRQELKRAINRFVNHGMFADLRQHGNTRWTYECLLRVALCWTISECRTWRRKFRQAACVWIQRIDDGEALTFEGFLKAVRRDYTILSERMSAHLRKIMLQMPSQVRLIKGRNVFASDSTTLAMPRTVANQKYFCGADVDLENADGTESEWKMTPQMRLTLLWQVALAVPWAWYATPSDISEREALRMLLALLPANSLGVYDAGFVGYDLWKTHLDEGVDFVARVGSNVHLIEGLEAVGDRKDLVSFWPNEARRAGHPPLLLRLVKAKLANTDVYLVTNVLDPADLSDADIVSIYKARWDVEVFFRGLKQTFAKRKLTGRTPDSALAEIELAMLSLWMLHLLGIQESKEIRSANPSVPRLSTSRLLDALRDAIESPQSRPLEHESLAYCLRVAHLDDYTREGAKSTRPYPRKCTHKQCGSPVIRPPKHEEQTKLKTLIRKGLYEPIAI